MSAAVARRSVMTASRMARTSIEAPTVSILELAKQDLDQKMKKAKVQSNYKRSGLNPRPPLASEYSYSYNLNLNSSFSVSAPAGECPAGNMRGRYACCFLRCQDRVHLEGDTQGSQRSQEDNRDHSGVEG